MILESRIYKVNEATTQYVPLLALLHENNSLI